MNTSPTNETRATTGDDEEAVARAMLAKPTNAPAPDVAVHEQRESTGAQRVERKKVHVMTRVFVADASTRRATRRDARGGRPRVHRADASEISFARAGGARPARGLRDVDFILMLVLSITIRVWARFTLCNVDLGLSVHRGEKDRRNRRYLSIESIHSSSDSA